MATILDRSDVRVSRSAPDGSGTWRQAVDALSQSNLGHSPEWFTAVQNAYGHDPLYLSAEDGEGRLGLLPAFVVRRPFFGTVVTSMPFLDAGGPCSSSVTLTEVLVEHLTGEARRIGAQVVELRCTERLALASQPMEHKVNLTLELPADSDRLWRQLDAGVRNQVRKAERSGLSVEVDSVEKLTAFYDIFAARMRDLGSPVHAPGFFRAIVDSFGERARIVLVRKGRTPVGGLVALAFKDRLAVPWASCLKDYLALCSNMLLYWEILRTACAEGFRRFDFGRSSRGSGTYRFKRQWGAREEPLFWYTIPIASRRGPSRSRATTVAPRLAKVWQRLPLPVTRRLGPPIRKYLTQ
jgi:FemAB-related protein (PEP-CTERM system-associated)